MIQFTFQNPSLLLLLLLLPPLWWLICRAQKRRDAVHTQVDGGVPVRWIWTDRLRLAAVTLLLLALARPGVNPRRQSISKSGRDVVFVLDVSQSMLARDAFPSRLDAAKDGIRDALDSFQSERVALVIYAGSANILCPLTYDYEFARYMLDQATPRAVDFGGTTLLSAAEKCADTILTEQRQGMQDLVVLTDGEEHGPQNDRVVELLSQYEAGVMMIGIGDATSGARIPIESAKTIRAIEGTEDENGAEDENGSTDYLKDGDQIVTTRLNESGLRELARLSPEASHVSVGTDAFDLGGIYSNYAANKPIADTVGSDSYVVYRELGFFLIAVALVMLLLAEMKMPITGQNPTKPVRKAFFLACAVLVGFISGAPTVAEDPAGVPTFADAMLLQEQGRCADALEAYGLVESNFSSSLPAPEQLATLRVNQGLCYLDLAAQQNADPRSELSLVRNAQTCFLDACRLQPGFEQAGRRLDPTASLISEIRQRIAVEDERDQALEEQLQELVKLLQQLQKEQSALRETIPARPRSQRKSQSIPGPIVEPETAVNDSKKFSQQQVALRGRGKSILETMKDLDEQMASAQSEENPAALSFLEEPMQLMRQAVDAQNIAVNIVQQWNTWPAARDQQQLAIARIQEILDLLAKDNSGDSDEGEWDDEEEYDEMMESSDSENSMMSSMQGQGDFASGSNMQPLPTPNYSVEDILQQEQGSLQFRQQQRAKGNQSKVEKDW